MTRVVQAARWERLERLSLPQDHAQIQAWLGERLTRPTPRLASVLGASPQLTTLRLSLAPSPPRPRSATGLTLRLECSSGRGELQLGIDLVQALLAVLWPHPATRDATAAPPLPVTPTEAGTLTALVTAALADLAPPDLVITDVVAEPRSPSTPPAPRGAGLGRPWLTPALCVAARLAVGERSGWCEAWVDDLGAAALHQAAHHAPPAYHAARARALPLDCTFVAARAALPASRVADLVPGDVVLFADTPAARRGSIPGWLAVGRYACAARLDRTATGRQVTVTNEVTPMSSLSPASTAPGADVLEHLPVTLSVTLGTVTLSAADVTRLAPGAVIELATPLAGPVEVHAGARAIATGELVEVDGALGVRLLQLLP